MKKIIFFFFFLASCVSYAFADYENQGKLIFEIQKQSDTTFYIKYWGIRNDDISQKYVVNCPNKAFIFLDRINGRSSNITNDMNFLGNEINDGFYRQYYNTNLNLTGHELWIGSNASRDGCYFLDSNKGLANYKPLNNFIIFETKPTPKPPITGYFDIPTVSSGAVTWNMILSLSEEGEISDLSRIQIWNKFKINSQTKQDKKIILSISQNDGDRLAVECDSYSLTIPSSIIQNTDGTATNKDPITGSFTVANCPVVQTQPTNTDQATGSGTEMKYTNTMKDDGLYLSILDQDENGKQYININNLVFLLGFVVLFLFVFWLFFAFLKNSFLGKK